MKKIIERILRWYTERIIHKYAPKIVGVTGSVGKTSTKEAIFTVLSSRFRVRRSMKNYNNELGVPLTFIGAESAGRSILGWISVFWKAQQLLWIRDQKYPEVIVIEMGSDYPGDIKYLVDFVPLDIAVMTVISESHLEKFSDQMEKIYQEKSDLVRYLSQDAYAIVNADNKFALKASKETSAHVLTYGLIHDADVAAIEMLVAGKSFDASTSVSDIRGVSFKLQYQGSTVPVHLPKVLGTQHISAALAASSVGLALGMNLVEISESLKRYTPPLGRMNLIEGVKHTLIVDDTYNASPTSAKNALEAASQIKLHEGRERFVVLGDMLELGAISEDAHHEIGRLVAKLDFDYLLTVGELAREYASGAREAGMPEDRVFVFSQTDEAGKFLQGRIETGDLILIKGSQGARMEKIVKEIMAEPLRAKELLVRQDESWIQS